MTSKIHQLTPEQIDLIPAHIEKWKILRFLQKGLIMSKLNK